MQPSKRGLRIFHKGLILVLLPLFVEIAFISALALLLWQSDMEAAREFRYRRCAAAGAKLITLTNDLALAGFYCYQGDTQFFLRVYDNDYEKLKQRMAQLKAISKGDRLAEAAADELVDGLNDLLPVLDKLVAPARSGKGIAPIAETLMQTTKKFQDERIKTIERLSAGAKIQNEMYDQSRMRSLRLQAKQSFILAFGFVANLAVGIALILFYRRSIVLRLRTIMTNTRLLSENKQLSASLAGADEIAELDLAFHQMERELNESAKREVSLFANATDVICALDGDLNFTKVNPACKKLWGFNPSELVGQSVKKVLLSEGNTDKLAALTDANSPMNLELSIRKEDGSTADNLWSTYYSRSEGKLYCIVHDISERKQIERMKQAFLDTMGIDLARPLELIMADISKLLGPLKQELSQAAISRLETTQHNMGRLLDLVSDLLKMSGLQSGSLESSKRTCKVADLIEHAARDLEGMARQKNISFDLQCRADHCYASPNRIIQVLVNLASNAIKFSNPGTIVTIAAREWNDYVYLEVSDQGRGVPASHIKAIFEKFGQVDAADGKRKQGTGLGLPICKEIVEENCGEIGVISEEGKGSKFWIKLLKNESAYNKVLTERQSSAQLQQQKLLPSQSSKLQLSLKASAGNNIGLLWKGLMLVGVPVFVEIILVSTLSFLLFQTEKSRLAELHERLLAASAYQMLSTYSTLCGVIAKAPKMENWLIYDSLCSQIIVAGAELDKQLSKDKAAYLQYQPVAAVHEKVVQKIEQGRAVMKKAGSPDKDTIKKAMINRYDLWPFAAYLAKRLGKIVDEAERREFINPKKQLEIRKAQGILLFASLLANVGLSVYLAVFFSKDITSRLYILTDNAHRFAKEYSLNDLLPGRDEISKLDQEFHRVADKLTDARQKERAIFDNSKDLVFVIDPQGHFLNTNRATEQTFMMAKTELQSRFLPDFLSSGWDTVATALDKGGLEEGIILEAQLKEDAAKFILLSFSRSCDQSDIYCIGHDISDRKALERMKQDFLAVVSHDLRSPLTAVLASTTMIEAGVDGEIGAEAMSIVLDIACQSEQLIELISDLLDYEKLSAGKMQFAPHAIESRKLLLLCEEQVQKRYEDLLLTVEGPQAEIVADAERIAQALGNILCLMARKSVNGAQVTVLTGLKGDFFEISLKDSDPDMSLAEAVSLFDHMKASRSSSLHMSSLALPLARLIIEAHGGTVTVRDDEASLIYTVALPLKPQDSSLNQVFAA